MLPHFEGFTTSLFYLFDIQTTFYHHNRVSLIVFMLCTSVHNGLIQSIWVLFGPLYTLWSHFVHSVLFSPLWFHLVHFIYFGLLWSNLVLFGPFSSIRSTSILFCPIKSYYVHFGPFVSISVHFCALT